MRLWALAFVLGATFCWASSQVIGKIVLRRIRTLTFNALRFSVAAAVIVVMGLLFGSLGEIELGLPFLMAVLSGVLGWFIATTVFFHVLSRGAAHRIIPSGNAYPFWAILLGALLLDEHITALIPLSAFLVFSGTYLLSRRRGDEGDEWKYGVPLASSVAFIWGLNAVFNKFALEGGMEPFSVLAVRIVSATALFWLALVFKGWERDISGRSLGLSALSGLVAFPVGSFLYVWALSAEEASTLAPVSGATVLFGFLLSVGFLGESPTRNALLGVLAIFGGILLMMI